MNERIRQLAETALEYAQKNQSAYIPQHWFGLYNEKFAELIVAECIAICQDVDGEDNIDARSGRQACAVEISELKNE
jgi:hypothetical protein